MAHRKPHLAKVRSTASRQNSKQNASVHQAAKKKHQKWSKDRSERVRDDLNRDAHALYNVMEKPSQAPSSVPLTDSVISLSEGMQELGR